MDKQDNVVYIGKKPMMNYVLAVITQFQNGSEEVIIKARGNSIGRAVDVAEVIRNRFMPDCKLKNIKISTEQLKGEGGRLNNVSSIEIFLTQ